MASGTYPHRGALVLEDNARADLYSCDFEAPYTLWMHPSAVAHVYCTYSAGLNAAYDFEGDTSAGTLVDYSGQGCLGDATVVAMDDTLRRWAAAGMNRNGWISVEGVEWNGHRVYGPIRMPFLATNWRMLYMRMAPGGSWARGALRRTELPTVFERLAPVKPV